MTEHDSAADHAGEAPDAITLLRQQHLEVEALFGRIERLQPVAQSGHEPYLDERRSLIELIVNKLMKHANIEEELFYPAVAEHVSDGEQLAEQATRQHSEAEEIAGRIDGLSPDNVDFDENLRALILAVRTHVRLEETEIFPRIEAALGHTELQRLGERLAKAMKSVPTRPHPHTPPATTTMGKLLAKGAAVADRVRDAATGRERG